MESPIRCQSFIVFVIKLSSFLIGKAGCWQYNCNEKMVIVVSKKRKCFISFGLKEDREATTNCNYTVVVVLVSSSFFHSSSQQKSLPDGRENELTFCTRIKTKYEKNNCSNEYDT